MQACWRSARASGRADRACAARSRRSTCLFALRASLSSRRCGFRGPCLVAEWPSVRYRASTLVALRIAMRNTYSRSTHPHGITFSRALLARTTQLCAVPSYEASHACLRCLGTNVSCLRRKTGLVAVFCVACSCAVAEKVTSKYLVAVLAFGGLLTSVSVALAIGMLRILACLCRHAIATPSSRARPTSEALLAGAPEALPVMTSAIPAPANGACVIRPAATSASERRVGFDVGAAPTIATQR